MGVVIDDYLPREEFKELQEFCKDTEFQIFPAGDKSFLAILTPESLLERLEINGHNIIFSFIRKAHKDFDTDLRIHADGIIMGKKTSAASVLYINDDNITENGTAFYDHYIHGHKLPEGFTEEEFDRLLSEDSNDGSKWQLTAKIEAKPNRMLVYNSNHFHAKYPQVIEEGERIVCVTFYEKI